MNHNNEEVREKGKKIHLILNETISRKLEMKEYEKLIRLIDSLFVEVQSNSDRARAEERERCLDIVRKENYELEEFYINIKSITPFDASQRNMKTRNNITKSINQPKV